MRGEVGIGILHLEAYSHEAGERFAVIARGMVQFLQERDLIGIGDFVSDDRRAFHFDHDHIVAVGRADELSADQCEGDRLSVIGKLAIERIVVEQAEQRQCIGRVGRDVGTEIHNHRARCHRHSAAIDFKRVGLAVIGVGANEPVFIDGHHLGRADLRLGIDANVHIDGGRRDIAVGVLDRVGEAVGPGIAIIGRVGEGPVAIIDGGAVQRLRAQRDIAVLDAIGALHVIDEDVDLGRRVFRNDDRRAGRAIVLGLGQIVDHLNVERRACVIAVAVDDDDREAVDFAPLEIFNRRGQFIDIVVAAVGIDGDGELAELAVDSTAIGDVLAIDDELGQRVVAGGEVEVALGEFTVGGSLTAASVEAGFIDGLVRAFDHEHGGRAVRQQVDRHRRGRGIAVAVDDAIAELDLAFFAGSRCIGEGAVAIIDDATRAREAARHQSDAGDQIDAIRARRVIAEDIDLDRGILATLITRVIARGRHIVGDVDGERRGIGVAVDIGDGDGEDIPGVVARSIVTKRIAEADDAGRDRGDGERAVEAFDLLADRGDHHAVHDKAVDRDDVGAVGRLVDDRARGGFAVAGVIRAGRFAVARGQARFADIGGGILHTRRIVVGDDNDIGFVVVGKRAANLLFGRQVEEAFGGRQEVAQRLARAKVGHQHGEIASARLDFGSAGGFRFVADEQRGEVCRRNLHRADDQLRNEDGTVDNHHLAAVGKRDHEIAANHLDIVELDAVRKRHDAVGAGRDQHRVRAHCRLRDDRCDRCAAILVIVERSAFGSRNRKIFVSHDPPSLHSRREGPRRCRFKFRGGPVVASGFPLNGKG